jgi:hypothetical protein
MHLQRLIRIYHHTHGPRHLKILGFYKSLDSLKEVIKQGTLANRGDGKMHGHQRRVGHKVLCEASLVLLEHSDEIKNCSTFADLLNNIERWTKGIYRFGKLAAYDTALRIGARLDLWPEVVYLHTGTKKGCAALGFTTNRPFIQMDELPSPLHELQPHEVENFLCIFKDKFGEEGEGKVVEQGRY